MTKYAILEQGDPYLQPVDTKEQLFTELAKLTKLPEVFELKPVKVAVQYTIDTEQPTEQKEKGGVKTPRGAYSSVTGEEVRTAVLDYVTRNPRRTAQEVAEGVFPILGLNPSNSRISASLKTLCEEGVLERTKKQDSGAGKSPFAYRKAKPKADEIIRRRSPVDVAKETGLTIKQAVDLRDQVLKGQST